MSFAQLFWERGKQLSEMSISLILKTAMSSVSDFSKELLQASDTGMDYVYFSKRLVPAFLFTSRKESSFRSSFWFVGPDQVGCQLRGCSELETNRDFMVYQQACTDSSNTSTCLVILIGNTCRILWAWNMLMQFLLK